MDINPAAVFLGCNERLLLLLLLTELLMHKSCRLLLHIVRTQSPYFRQTAAAASAHSNGCVHRPQAVGDTLSFGLTAAAQDKTDVVIAIQWHTCVAMALNVANNLFHPPFLSAFYPQLSVACLPDYTTLLSNNIALVCSKSSAYPDAA